MNMLKRTLAMMLVLCMLFTMAPITAFAEDTTDPAGTATPAAEQSAADEVPEDNETEDDVTKDDVTKSDESKDDESKDDESKDDESKDDESKDDESKDDVTKDDESKDDETKSDEPAADEKAATDPTVDPNAVVTTGLEEDIAVTSTSISTITMGTKPADGTTSGEPFPQGAGGSNSFRIPALVTLENGNLVAAADARWNTTYDGGGLDTIVARSYDSGSNWSYTFANYLGDNGNEYNGSGSTAFIDPALAVIGNTVYMLCDLYPYGVALNGSIGAYPSHDVGFNADGKLLLSGDNHSSYSYYLDGDTIYSSDGTAVSGYTVDKYFNITAEDGTTSNLFFSNSPYKVVRTGFLYLTKSTDAGATWSAPQLLNLKTSSEQVCLVGPGRGLVTSTGMIVFPTYSYKGNQNSQVASFVYSNDGGYTWNRSANFTGASWSSESAVVELNSGALRFFYRNGTTNLCYVDYNGGWGTPVVMSGIDTNSNCQISAITYSKPIDGKQVILVSCPTGPSEAGSDQSGASYRLNGKIFAFTVESDGSMTKVGSVNVTSNDNQFMYSCLTELADGTVGILYEDKENAWGTGDSCYYTMSYAEYDLATAMGLTFDSDSSGEDTETEGDVTITAGATMVSATKVENISALSGKTYLAYDITVSEEDVESVTVVVKLNNTFADDAVLVAYYIDGTGAIAETIDGTYDVEADTFTFVAEHFSTYAVAPRDAESDENVRIPVGGTSETYTISGVYDNDATDDGLNTTIATATKGGAASQEVTVYKEASVYCSTLISSSTNSWTACSDCYYTPDGNNYYPVYAKRSGTNTYTYTWGYSTTSSSGNVSQISTQNVNRYYASSTKPNITVYTNSTTTGDPYTTVVFEGKTVGTTSATIAGTTFSITVYATRNINVIYQMNGVTVATENMAVESDAQTVTLPTHVMGNTGTAYQVQNTTLTLVDGTVNYIVEVTELAALDATVAENASETLELEYTLSAGQYVEWTTADSSYVAVAGAYDSDGSYTNKGTIIGNKVTETGSKVLVTGTVYNADGTVAYASSWQITVTAGSGNTNTTSKYIYINITRIQNTTVYYNINGGELIQITDDMLDGPYADANGTYYKLKVALKDEQYTGGFQISFFAAPDEGYALTYMSSTNSAGEYYTLSDGNADGVGSDAWPFVDGYNYDSFDSLTTKPAGGDTSVFDTSKGIRWGLCEGNFTVAQMKVMFANAISKGCDGILVFTKNSTDGLNTELAFVSQKLPELEKKIASITHSNNTTETYTDGMTLALGDTINYTITVYEPTMVSEYGSITYTGIKLKDPLTGNTWTSKSSSYQTGTYTFTNSATGEELTMAATAYTYTPTPLTLAVTNLLHLVDDNGYITNTADLEYTYSSQYSSGTLDETASAAAQAKVEVPEYVIDFGLPVQFNLTNNPLIEGYETIVSATAQYGNVTFDGLTVTYTPTKILQGNDFIRLTIADNDGRTDNIGYGIRIYPATTVYYEESFITWGSNWSGGNEAITVDAQETEQLNVGTQAGTTSDEGKQHNYGYDPAYVNTTGASNATNATTSTIGAKATFTFTGDGIQVFANAGEDTGYVSVQVKNSSGAVIKMSMVDTVVDEGTTGATSGQTGNMYGLPIVSLVDLQNMAHDTYTVTITKIMDTEPVYIDGIRVFNTMEDSSIFANDLEDNPEFYELRDSVLKAININDTTSQDYGTLAEMADQVYAGVSTDSEAPVAMITENKGADDIYGDGATAQDLLDNGPKNELYLYTDQTLTFKVNTSRIMQIGLKAPQGVTTASITVNNGSATTQAVNSSVDMFYNLVSAAAGSDTDYTVSITNNGTTILSVTLLKVCDDPSFAFASLTAEDIENVLIGIYDLSEEEVEIPSEPSEPEIPEEPTEPENEPTKPTKPGKPEKPDNGNKPGNGNNKPTEPSKPGNGNNNSGKPSADKNEKQKDAKLKITFVNLMGKKVASSTLTKTGTANQRCVFSADEITANAPARRYAVWFFPVIIPYGSTSSIVVPVF